MFAIMMFLHGRHCSSSVFLLVFNEYIDNLNSDFISRLLSSSRIYWYQIFLYCYTTMYWKLTAMWWENGCLLFVKTKTKEWDSLESLFAQHNQILHKTVFCDCLSQWFFDRTLLNMLMIYMLLTSIDVYFHPVFDYINPIGISKIKWFLALVVWWSHHRKKPWAKLSFVIVYPSGFLTVSHWICWWFTRH